MKPSIAVFGSSLMPACSHDAASYCRGAIRALAALGYRITLYEPDACDRQRDRDPRHAAWAKVVAYPADPRDESGVHRALDEAASADIIVKISGSDVFDGLIERAVAGMRTPRTQVIFWDTDALATLDRLAADPRDPFRALVPCYDLILTRGGGKPVVKAYQALGARRCVPVFDGLDPAAHHPVSHDSRFDADLGFLGDRLPDLEARVDQFFLNAATRAPLYRFLLGGNGWCDKRLPPNVRYIGHVYTADRNAFNCTPRVVLDISRDGMARCGFSPAPRMFEAAGAGACVIADAWTGIALFLEPDREVLVARDGCEVASLLRNLDPARARLIGMAARARMLAEHTYTHRAELLDGVLTGGDAGRRRTMTDAGVIPLRPIATRPYQAGEHVDQRIEVDGFREIRVEPGFETAPAIGFARVGGQRDYRNPRDR